VRVMATIRLEHLGTLTSVEKICLGRDLSIPSWVKDGFVGLIKAETISYKALQIDLGASTTAYKVFRIRGLIISNFFSNTNVAGASGEILLE
jgi:hypothetical protein